MKNRALVIVFCVILVSAFAAGLILPDKEASFTERRKLAQLPGLTWRSIENGSFMDGFDSYVSDQFPLRDALRSVGAYTRLKLLGQRDINGVFEYEGGIYKLEKTGSADSPEKLAAKINDISGQYLKGEVYVCVIPEKNAFIAESGYPLPDYDAAARRFYGALSQDIRVIDLSGALTLEDYYKTDLHWRQERLAPVLERLGGEMGFAAELSGWEQASFSPFYGGYYAQLGLAGEGDTLIYLKSEQTQSAAVTMTGGQDKPVYCEEELSGMDAYDVFLSGAESVLTIRNPSAPDGKKLVIFRDSFASSLAPLLLSAEPGYSEIALVDLRYITPALAQEYIGLSRYDQALFLYSTVVVRNSAMLK